MDDTRRSVHRPQPTFYALFELYKVHGVSYNTLIAANNRVVQGRYFVRKLW